MPESARYLLAAGKPKKAQAVLEKACKENGTVMPEGELIPDVKVSQSGVTK